MDKMIDIARGIMRIKGYDSTTKVKSGVDEKEHYLDDILEKILIDMEANTLIEYFEEVLYTNDLTIIEKGENK